MIRIFWILCFSIFISTILSAQTRQSKISTLYMPLNIKKAYEKGTRSYNGMPGKNYWTNHTDYRINARLIPESRLLSGQAEIVYYNDSPDTLSEIVLRLYQDFFKKGNQRDWSIGDNDLHDGIDLQSIVINDKLIDTSKSNSNFRRYGTNATVKLDNLLFPGQSIQLEIEWSFTISRSVNMRMGRYDSSSFFIAYWYPQIAVYDDIDGWDKFHFGGLQEFYNDKNNYDVTIKMPSDFIVWATGELQNTDDLFTDEYLDRIELAKEADSVIHIISSEDLGMADILEDADTTEWRYVARGVPDFAFATSDHYLWDGISIQVNPESDKRVFIGAVFRENSMDFYEVAEITRQSLKYFSEEIPGIPFPYPEMTIFNGKGGMEFPMMVNNSSNKSRSGTVHLTTHEVVHSYMPFYMGTNERKYAWMDEGWAVMLPFEIQNQLEPNYDPIKKNNQAYLRYAGEEMEIPLMIPSIIPGGNAFRPSYRIAAYNRSAAAYYFLMDLMGRENFLEALQTYMKNWHGKHPIPYDFFFIFDRINGDSLDWFWKPWFFESGYPDLAIRDIFSEKKTSYILIEKVGNIPVPIELKVLYSNDKEISIYKSAAIWKNGAKRVKLEIKQPVEIKYIHLGSEHIPDVDETNNVFPLNN